MTLQLYRLLLCLYPSRYRSTFGREMADVFRQAQADAWNRGAVYGTIFCIREFGGVALAAVHGAYRPLEPVYDKVTFINNKRWAQRV